MRQRIAQTVVLRYAAASGMDRSRFASPSALALGLVNFFSRPYRLTGRCRWLAGVVNFGSPHQGACGTPFRRAQA